MNEKRRAVFRLLFAFSVFLNIVLLSATGWFANRDSRSQSLVRELKRNLEQLENQLTGSLDRVESLRGQIQSVVDTGTNTYHAVDTSLNIAEDLGRIVENLGRAIDRSAERTDQLRGEIAAARQRIEESLEGIGRIQETGGRSTASYNEIRSRLERGISDIDRFLTAGPE